MTNNIVLIGFMGSGKSTVGRELARKLNRWFIDSDNIIENYENRSINDIFEVDGEKYFRDKEQDCIDWIKTSVNNTVISTGGGMPIYCEGLKGLGKTVFLKTDFETVKQRLKFSESKKRPLLAKAEFAKNLYDERVSKYAFISDITIDANRSVDVITDDIVKKLESAK